MTSSLAESAVQEFSKETGARSLAANSRGELPWSDGVLTRPILFQFHWRGRHFRGSIAPRSQGYRVALTTFLAREAAGTPGQRGTVSGSLVAVIDIEPSQSQAQIKLVAGQDALLDETFAVPPTPLAVDGFVTSLTIVVLSAAPYLDLLSDATRLMAPPKAVVAA